MVFLGCGHFPTAIESSVLLDVGISLWICELCCACLTVSGDGALLASN